MIYCISDLHGEYDKWLAILQKINFSNHDTLYVLGDIVDRGAEPMRLLLDMKSRANVIPLMGNQARQRILCKRISTKSRIDSFEGSD